MLKRVVTLGLTGLAAAAMTASPAAASSHREAPLISNDPVADLADTFMWVDQKDPSKLNLVMTANPLENPGDAPNYYGFGQHVRYQFNIDNNGDARADISYRVVFTTHVRNKGTFLYNIPGNPVTSLSDPGLNVYQTYSVDRLNYGKHGKLVGTVHLAKNLKTVPNNVGPASMPNYPQLVKLGVKPLAGHGGKVWAGQSDDPFFLGLGDIGDSLQVKPKGVAKDTLGGMNVQAIALHVPKSHIVKTGHPTIGMYAETDRQSFTNELTGSGHGSWVQIERLGNPLVNEVLIPLGQKDHWNHVEPHNDGQFGSFFKAPQLAAALGDTHTPRNDILAILETGLPGLNKTGNVHADMLRLNTSIDPTAMGHESPLGVLGGDTAGFPNGRRPLDDVTDIELRALAGATDTPAIPNSASDGVQRNDESFDTVFPYLAQAQSGTAGIHQVPTP